MLGLIASEPQTPMISIATLHQLVVLKGHQSYGGEPVSQAQHALQCATLARRDGCDASLVVACLLHDVGHQLDRSFSEDIPGINQRHEVLGAHYLSDLLPVQVTHPILQHVTAKRYLCATEPGYRAMLSDASLHSLSLQGGPLDRASCRQFESEPFARDAVRLRRYDDLAKDPTFEADAWESFLPELKAVLTSTPIR